MSEVRVDGVGFGYSSEKSVLSDISFSVGPGETLGLLGRNGAGKTTLFRLLAGLRRPDVGEIRIDGVSVHENPREARRRSAYVPDEPLLYPVLSGLENLNMFGLLWGVDAARLKERSEELLKAVDLWAVRHQWARTYSRGMRQRLALCAALVHDPAVLLMDEPFLGLDLEGVVWARDMLQKFTADGGSVVLASHLAETIEVLADHVVLLHGGRVRYRGARGELERSGGVFALYREVTASGEVPA